jgi:hypothetical protein
VLVLIRKELNHCSCRLHWSVHLPLNLLVPHQKVRDINTFITFTYLFNFAHQLSAQSFSIPNFLRIKVLFQPISSKGSHSDRHQSFSNSPLSPLLLLGEVWLIKSVSVSCLRFKLPTNHHGSQHARPDSTTRRDQLSRTRFVCPCVISTRDLTLLEPRTSQVSYTSSNCKMRR